MALIKCNECGHEVSDKASMCPNCSCPIESLGAAKEEVMYEEPKKKKGWIWALIAVSLCLVLGGGYYAYTKFFKSVSDKDAIVELTPEFIKAIEKYDQLGIFSEGYAAVRKGDRWGYINTKGEEVIPCNIDASCVGPFSEGLAFVDNNEIVGHERIFSVIDYNGNVIFKGKNYLNESTIFESHDMPYFIKGKIYVPTLDSKQDVYDKQGNKLETISWEEADSILSRYVNCSQECFFEDTNCIGEGEKRLFRRKWGVKDSVGKVLISAKYDEIATTHRTNILRPLISNGVILVVLEEPEEGHYTDGTVYDPSIRHYGYVDLKGNDTFSEELKARCLKAEIKAMDNCKSYLASFEQQEWDNTESYSDEYSQTSYNNERIVNNSTASNGNSINNELAEYDRTIEATVPIMEKAYQQFLRDVRSGGYTTITPPSSFYELSNACTNVGAAAKQAQRLCERNGNMGNAQRYERIWEHERQLYNSAYNILGNLH